MWKAFNQESKCTPTALELIFSFHKSFPLYINRCLLSLKLTHHGGWENYRWLIGNSFPEQPSRNSQRASNGPTTFASSDENQSFLEAFNVNPFSLFTRKIDVSSTGVNKSKLKLSLCSKAVKLVGLFNLESFLLRINHTGQCEFADFKVCRRAQHSITFPDCEKDSVRSSNRNSHINSKKIFAPKSQKYF